MRTRHVRDLVDTFVVGGIGAGVGYGISRFAEYRSDIAFRVRPELANLEWTEAFFSDHFSGYLWHFGGDAMTVATVGLGAVIGLGAALYYKKR